MFFLIDPFICSRPIILFNSVNPFDFEANPSGNYLITAVTYWSLSFGPKK